MERITITIKPDADVTVRVDGVAGPSCRDLTKIIERAIGTTTADEPTADIMKEADNVNEANQC